MKLGLQHYIYTSTLAEAFDKYFGCVVSHPEGELSCVDYSRPGLQQFSVSKLEFDVTGFPEEEAAILDYFRWYEPQLGDTVFDLGANCGLSAYYFSIRVGPTGKVYAFEPDLLNYEMLLRNIERHHLVNVIPLRKAIASQTGQMTFFSEGTIGSTLAQHSNRPSTGTIETVETMTLEDASQAYGIPSFIKMDIEGAEIDVIGSSLKLMEQVPLNFAVDTNHWKNGQLTDKAVEGIFEAAGYETMSSNESGFMTTWGRKIKTAA